MAFTCRRRGRCASSARRSPDASAFDKLFADRAFARHFPGGFSDERKSSRPPRGFDPHHPKIEWLKLQAFFVWRPYKLKEFAAKDFASIVAKDFEQVLRLNHLLDQALENRLPTVAPAGMTRAKPSTLGSRLDELDGRELPALQMDF